MNMLTMSELDSILSDLWTEPLYPRNTIPIIMSLDTKRLIEEALEVWRKRRAAIELRATVYRMNAGNRRRQQRRGK